jgi:hypothetical protein
VARMDAETVHFVEPNASIVPAFPSVTMTALATNSVWARPNSPRIVDAFGADHPPDARSVPSGTVSGAWRSWRCR